MITGSLHQGLQQNAYWTGVFQWQRCQQACLCTMLHLIVLIAVFAAHGCVLDRCRNLRLQKGSPVSDTI